MILSYNSKLVLIPESHILLLTIVLNSNISKYFNKVPKITVCFFCFGILQKKKCLHFVHLGIQIHCNDLQILK